MKTTLQPPRRGAIRLGCLALAATSLFTLTARSAPPVLNFTEKPIDQVGWSVQFESRQYDASTDSTTYNYWLTANSTEKDLSHWVLEICANQVPTGSGALTKTGLDPTTGVYGFKWDDGQRSGTRQAYYITMAGHYGEQPVKYSVKGGTYFAVGNTTGPTCEPMPKEEVRYNLTGIVFIDSNGNGVCDPNEPRLPNVSVNLADHLGVFIGTVMTDSDGSYIFQNLKDGSYCVGIQPDTTDVAGDLNETLAVYYDETTPSSLVSALNKQHSENNNFGFRPDSTLLVGDLRSGIFSGTGKTIGFWKHQNTVALTKRGRAQIDPATLLRYLAAVQAMFLPDPFRFTAGYEYRDALAVLESRSSDPALLLRKQLLALELNDAAGWGLVTGPQDVEVARLQKLLIAWAESLIANRCSDAGLLLQAKDICDLINNTGE